jgi:fatty-acyl-CoA synthase
MWIHRGARDWPDKLAVVDVARGEGGRFTYAALDERARRLAAWLRDAGVRRGDRVGLLAYNGVEYLDALYACVKLGAIFVPFNFRLSQSELAALCRQIDPAALLFGEDLQDGAAALLAASPRGSEGSTLPHLRAPYDDVLAATAPIAAADPPWGLEAEAPACLLFTGGTTGTPKAAIISYRMIAWNTLTTFIHELSRDDVTVVHTPMFHTGGLLVYAVPLLSAGGAVVIMRRWDPEQLLSLIDREGITLFFCVPTQYQQLLDSPRLHATDFSRVRFVTSGGAPLPVPLLGAFQAVHKVPFKQGFGMTEFGPGAFSMGPEFAISKAGSIGRPNAFVQARLIDAEGGEVPQGSAQAGELLLRGPACCSGYYGRPAESREAIDEDGWLHTGDLARVDEDGFFYIVGRKKDMFISGGENVYPPEIEEALCAHPAVLHCAVIGVPDERWGQVGRAFVVPRPGHPVTEEELLSFVRARLARYKVPKSMIFRDRLPMTAAGKILKQELLEPA